jgi:hypothetical protein
MRLLHDLPDPRPMLPVLVLWLVLFAVIAAGVYWL